MCHFSKSYSLPFLVDWHCLCSSDNQSGSVGIILAGYYLIVFFLQYLQQQGHSQQQQEHSQQVQWHFQQGHLRFQQV